MSDLPPPYSSLFTSVHMFSIIFRSGEGDGHFINLLATNINSPYNLTPSSTLKVLFISSSTTPAYFMILPPSCRLHIVSKSVLEFSLAQSKFLCLCVSNFCNRFLYCVHCLKDATSFIMLHPYIPALSNTSALRSSMLCNNYLQFTLFSVTDVFKSPSLVSRSVLKFLVKIFALATKSSKFCLLPRKTKKSDRHTNK